jgi:translation initiation factor eIF-2B subunit delta
MATETNGAPPAAAETPASATSSTAPAPVATPAAPAPAPAQANPPKLSNAELKAKQKAEKAARRAQAKEAKVAVAPPPAAAAQQQEGGKGGKQPSKGGKQDGGSNQEQQSTVQRTGQPPRRPSMGGKRPSLVAGAEQDPRAAIPECFSHIPMAKRIPTSQAHKDVHPAVLALGQQMATFTVRDSITRLKYMLLAFRKVSPPPPISSA